VVYAVKTSVTQTAEAVLLAAVAVATRAAAMAAYENCILVVWFSRVVNYFGSLVGEERDY